MAELPSGTVTFLFTDLEGSTRLWREHPEAMKPASACHDEILRDIIAAHSGHLVKTTGDGAHAVFATASDAVAAAVDAQLALGAEEWPVTEALRVRMGVHSGPAEVRDGDYYGTSVNRAARLMSVAHGGQIVVSLATEELLPHDEIELIDLGEHTLRDLARPERVFQVAHRDLERDFPSLASLDAFVGNLPVQVTSFVGRDEDVVRIVKLLAEASMVTLAGTGGVGKTRLAVQVAAQVVPRFADGVWFCELAAVDDDDAMTQAIAATVGCRPRPELSQAESIVEYLKVRELLLVLDNCEHLLDDAGELADLVLRSCPNVRVLATSREALDVAGERVSCECDRFLHRPRSAQSGELAENAAARLFADRATDAGADADADWDDKQWTAVGEICRRVDGIPLAIELAAARTTAMSPTDVAAHLDERFRLLTGKRRGRVERHQTLRATVEWSYQLLADDERSIFDRLGVFPGTFDAPAATAVARGDDLDAWLVTDALSSLVAKSMLVPETGSDGSTRYGMLETLRQFARERLDEVGETDQWRRALARHYAGATLEIGRGLVGSDHVGWMRRLREDLDNIRGAAAWALERDDLVDQRLALQMLAALDLTVRAYPDMGFGTLALEAIDVARRSPPELRVPVVSAAAHAEWNLGHIERARVLAHEAMSEGIVATINPLFPYVGTVVFEMAAGNFARGALEMAAETRAAVDVVESPFARAEALASIANFEAMAGRFDQARADAERAAEIARRTENVDAIAVSMHAIAWSFQREDPAKALAAAEKFVGLHREFGVGAGSAASVLALAGGLRARLHDDIGALELLHEGVVLARDQGLRPQFAAALDWAFGPLFRRGDADVVATFVGALTRGSLAGVGEWPSVAETRARSLERARSVLGEDANTCVTRGARMSYDEFVSYAIEHLEPGEVPDDL